MGTALPFIIGGAIVAQGAMKMYAGFRQAHISDANSQVEEQNALWAGQQGDITADAQGMKTGAEIGTTKARAAGAGVDSTTGSAAAIEGAQRMLGMANILAIRSNAAREVYGYKQKAQNDRMEAGSQRLGGIMGLLDGLVGGATHIQNSTPPSSSPGSMLGGPAPSTVSKP